MKRLFTTIAVIGLLIFGSTAFTMAQEDEQADKAEMQDTTEAGADTTAADTTEADTTAAAQGDETTEERGTLHKQIKQKFIEGGPAFMGVVLLALIFGLAISIERIIYLNLSTTNTEKLLKNVEDALEEGGLESAKEVCRNTRGPVASIFYQGLDRADEGIDVAEKSVISYGSVQAGLLEQGLTWVSLFIAIAPMLGFMGTVIGMIAAFDNIEAAGNISPSLVAGGIKVALITTVSGLIVGVILQLFYNYIVSKIDGIVNSMEDASISLIDLIYKYNKKKQ
ncbi:MAG: MotA/TolQ/ExbB proton channel family protein [Bacteroidales bacterium]